jgi:hypothetical protein
VPEPLPRTKELSQLAIKLADEGVPVRAIARAMGVSLADLREQFDEALLEGRILTTPRTDWPPRLQPSNQLPISKLSGIEERVLLGAVMRTFGTTECQSRLLLALIRRHELTREELHEVYNWRNGREVNTQMKILDVQFLRLKEALRRFDLNIETLWGFGRRMSWDDRKKAFALLLAELKV